MTDAGMASSGRRRRRVLYVQYTNPAAYPPLERSAEILAEAGFDVRLLGTAILGDALRFGPHQHVDVRLMRFQPAGWRQKVHYARFAIWVLRQALSWRPDWVYASEPLSCPIAWMLGALPGVNLVYHEHDSPTGEPTSRFMQWVHGMRRRVATRAALCIVPSSDRARAFSASTGRSDVLTVWNCPRQREIVSTRPAHPGIRVLYHGSIVPARLPLAVIDALAQLPAHVSLVVTGYETAGAVGHATALRQRAVQVGIADRVVFTGPVSRAALLEQAGTCDIGLALVPECTSDINQRTMVGPSNKAFDYLAAGLALVVTDLPDWRAVFIEPGLAVGCRPSSADSVAAALRSLVDQPDLRQRMAEAGRSKIAAAWNYERTFSPVLARVLGDEPALAPEALESRSS
jgi:glycosyltransferase involved in cell wall biosynthesis